MRRAFAKRRNQHRSAAAPSLESLPRSALVTAARAKGIYPSARWSDEAIILRIRAAS